MLAELFFHNKEQLHAVFTRSFPFSSDDVWNMLTDNKKLQSWFPELEIVEHKKGGVIQFDMQDGTFEEMKILAYHHLETLAFTWGEDSVEFQLKKKPEGCTLILHETIIDITPHTPRDLAGWHVCLDVIQTILAGEEVKDRKQSWGIWYDQYVQAIESIKQ